MARTIVLLVVVALLLFSCAAGPNEFKGQARPTEAVEAEAGQTDEAEPAGFFRGWWHGFISPVAFVVSLFNDSVGVYEPYNNGGWYNFGFIMGVSMIFGGSGGAGNRAWGKRRRRERDYDDD